MQERAQELFQGQHCTLLIVFKLYFLNRHQNVHYCENSTFVLEPTVLSVTGRKGLRYHELTMNAYPKPFLQEQMKVLD